MVVKDRKANITKLKVV